MIKESGDEDRAKAAAIEFEAILEDGRYSGDITDLKEVVVVRTKLRAAIAQALSAARAEQREVDARLMCFRCQRSSAYSQAAFTEGMGGTEPSGIKAWRHTDRGGAVFECEAAAIRQGKVQQ